MNLNRKTIFAFALMLSLLTISRHARCQTLSTDWKPLLNQSLEGWEVFTGIPHKSVTVPNFPQSTSEDSRTGTPVGLGDPLKIFQVKIENDEPILYVSGQVYAGLSTKASYENYHLSLEYKWGEKKWEPRLNQKRDSGVLIHCSGDDGAFWNAWMKSLECQVQEADTGDFIALAGTSASIEVDSLESKNPKFTAGAESGHVGRGSPAWGCRHNGDHEIDDDWNRVDIYTLGDQSVFAVNGHIVMRLSQTRNGSQNDGTPLSSGRIQIQSEAAEIRYRKIRIKKIDELPEGNTVEMD